MKVENIEQHMDWYEDEIKQLNRIINDAEKELSLVSREYKDFKLLNPHPNNKGGSGKYGAWTFEDTLEEVRSIQNR